MAAEFDVIVVGAGMMGSAAARHLALSGAKVAIVGPAEPSNPTTYDGPFASHHDAARITRQLDTDPVWSKLNRESIARYRALERETGISFFHEVGATMAVAAQHRDKSVLPDLMRLNRDLSIAADIKTGPYDLGGFAFPPGATILHEVRHAGYINPRQHIKAQLAAATARGAEWFRTSAIKVAQADRTAVVTLSDHRNLTAARVIVAAGPYSLSSALIEQPPPLRVIGRTIAFAELSPEQAKDMAAMPSLIHFPPEASHDLYVLPPVTYPDGKTYLKIGGEAQDRLLTTVEELNGWFRTDGSKAVGEGLLADLSRLIPELRPVSTHIKSCAVTKTATGRPYIYAASENVVALTGGNGAGAKNADELGRLGAVLALGGSIDDQGYDSKFTPGSDIGLALEKRR